MNFGPAMTEDSRGKLPPHCASATSDGCGHKDGAGTFGTGTDASADVNWQ